MWLAAHLFFELSGARPFETQTRLKPKSKGRGCPGLIYLAALLCVGGTATLNESGIFQNGMASPPGPGETYFDVPIVGDNRRAA